MLTSDRDALVAAVLASPGEDTPRLALADQLEESGTDHDRARAEFLRVSCRSGHKRLPDGSRVKKRVTPAEGRWLDRNWRRLLPHVAAMAVPGAEVTYRRHGRTLRLGIPYRRTASGTHVLHLLVLHLFHGVCLYQELAGPPCALFFFPAVHLDDPAARPRWGTHPATPVRVDGRRGASLSDYALGPIYEFVTGHDIVQDNHAWTYDGTVRVRSKVFLDRGGRPAPAGRFHPFDRGFDAPGARASAAATAATLAWAGAEPGACVERQGRAFVRIAPPVLADDADLDEFLDPTRI